VGYAKRLLVATLVAAMILSTAGVASAAPSDVVGTRYEAAVQYLYGLGVVSGRPDGFYPEEVITRAEAVKIAIEAQGRGDLAALLRGAPSFPDVPADAWYSGYVTLAKSLRIVSGWEDGTFRPNNPVTYAQIVKMLCEAAGLGPVEGLSWPANYMATAQAAGMLEDLPLFAADSPATRGDCAIMAAYTIQNVRNPQTGRTLAEAVFGESAVASLELSVTAFSVPVGGAVTCSAVAKDAQGNEILDVAVTFGTSDAANSAVSAPGIFIASKPGTYTVTARSGSASATATIAVWGAPVSISATVDKATVPANEKSVAVVTARVVDANGNVVGDCDDYLVINHDEDNGAVAILDASGAEVGDRTVKAEGGVATFKARATANPERTDTLLVYDYTDEDVEEGTVEISTVDQVATALTVKSEFQALSSNYADDTLITATVADQDGELMLYGVFEVTFAISGQGTFADMDTDPVKDHAIAENPAQTTAWSERGLPGSFTVAATSPGLTSGSVTVDTHVVGVPRAIKITVVDREGKADATDNDMELLVSLVDANGHPSPIPVGWITGEIVVGFDAPLDESGLWMADISFTQVSGDCQDTLTFRGTKAGTWTVKAEDVLNHPAAVTPTTFSVTVLPGSVEYASLSPESSLYEYHLPFGAPAAVFTVQLKDSEDNNSPLAGVDVYFDADWSGNGGVTWSKTDGKTSTDAAGKVTIAGTFQAYVGQVYSVTAWADLDDDGEYDAGEECMDKVGTAQQATLMVTDTVPALLSVSFRHQDAAGPLISRIPADVGELVHVTVVVKDENGNEVAGEKVGITFSDDCDNVQDVSLDYDVDAEMYVGTADGNGELTFTFRGAKAGYFMLTAMALDSLTSVSRTATFRTVAGSEVVGALVTLADGSDATEVDYDEATPVPVRVMLVDYGGNPVPPTADTEVFFAPANMEAGSVYRTTASGVAVDSVTIEVGRPYVTCYYVDDSDGILVNLSDDSSLGMLEFVLINPDFDNTNPEVWPGITYAHEVFRLVYNRGIPGQVRAIVTDLAGDDTYFDTDWYAGSAGEGKYFEWSYRDDVPPDPSLEDIWASDDTIVGPETVRWTVWLDGEDGVLYEMTGTYSMTEMDVRNADHLDFEGARTFTVHEDAGNDGSISEQLNITTGNHEFAADISAADVVPNNLPAGLGYQVLRLNATTLVITFTGNATSHDAGDSVTDVSFTIDGAHITYAGTPLSRDLTTENFAIEFITEAP
jgi:hypothetical protein